MAAALSTASATCLHGQNSGRLEQQDRIRDGRHHLKRLGVTAIALVALAWPKAIAPTLLWNASPSIPIGLYLATSDKPANGTLAIIRLPESVRRLAHQRGYLPRSALLIKPVIASAGDTVCRYGALIVVNGYWRAMAIVRDGRRRPLPRWRGCIRLIASQIFVLATPVESFDSRYVGPIERGNVLGTGVPIWTH